MNCYLQNYTTHQSTYFNDDFSQGMIKKSKNHYNPTNTSKDTSKTILIILLNLFLFSTSFKFKPTWIYR